MIYLLTICMFCGLLVVGCASISKGPTPPLPWEQAAQAPAVQPQGVVNPPGNGKPFTIAWTYNTNAVPGWYWLQESQDLIHWNNVMLLDGHTTLYTVTNNKPCEYFRFQPF